MAAGTPKQPRKILRAERRNAAGPAPQKRGGKKPVRKQKSTGKIRRALWSMLMFPFRIAWGFSWRIGLIIAIILGLSIYYITTTLPDAMELVDGRSKGSVTMLDGNGDVFAWRGDQFGGLVTTNSVSPYLKNAVIATEDKRFYRHFGISPRGVASAIRINMREGRGPFSGNGGSTITQQTAKLLCLGVPFDSEVWDSEREYEEDCRRTTIWRKVKEAVYALAMEAKFTKDEILTIYLNRAFLGAGSRGVEAASQRYFGLSAKDVDGAQSAMLAGLLKAPSRYAPTRNLERAQGRAQVVVGLMEAQGYLTKGEADFARAKPATLSPAARAQTGGFFADWVMQSGPEYFTRNTTEDVIIRTTLNPRIQRATEKAIDKVFLEKVSKSSRAEVGVVVMAPDGAVLAMVGGREKDITGAFNRATQAKRQTGSIFKPFVFAAGLEMGWSPNDVIKDEPVTYRQRGSAPWKPKNFTKNFKGNVTLTRALMESINIPAVKLSEAVGRDNVRKLAADFGINNELAKGPAVALGVSESTVLEMTGAYAGILNGGVAVIPYGLEELRFQGDSEPLAGKSGGLGERVIRQSSAEQLTYMMNLVIEKGTGKRARIPGFEAAGKTGTTQAAKDAWFIGFTSDYVIGVWLGYDDNTPLKGTTGSGLPAEIWKQVMLGVSNGKAPAPLPMIKPAPKQPAKPATSGTGRAGGGSKPAKPQPAQPKPEQPKPSSTEEAIVDLLKGILQGG